MSNQIKTYSPTTGKYNGFVIPIWNVLEHPEDRPDQVYLTAIAPHSRKGPHLHMKRVGRFTCIRGNVRLVWRETITATEGSAWVHHTLRLGDNAPTRSYTVPAGIPCALYNDADLEALVINCPTPSWSKEDPDEHPVTHWID